jgi:hypothetical protein
MPVFPGGPNSIWCFLEKNFQYEILNAGNKEVKFITRFIVDTLGKTTDIKIMGSIPQNIIFDHQDSLKISEIVRVLELMQTWQPATQNNKKVRCLYTIPIMTPYKEFRCRQFQKKKITATNSDGLIKCLPPTQDSFLTSTKIYACNFCNIYKILWHPDSFVSRDSIFGLAGPRAGALFFARHLDNFIVTRNCSSTFRDWYR